MEQKKKAASGGKALYWFGAGFTALMLISMLLDSWIKGGFWIRPMENKWSDIRTFLPQYLSFFQADSDFTSSIGKYYNRRADERITIVAIDEYTVKEMGYPFKRKYYATLIEKLNQAGVKAIGIDILLADSDRDDLASDQRLVEAVRKAGNVSALLYMDPQTGELKYPIKGLGEMAKIISHPHVENEMESNGQVRRVNLFSATKGYQDLQIKPRCGKDCMGVGLPLLAMGTYAIYKNEPLKDLESSYGTEAERVNFRTPQDRPIHPGWEKNKNLNTEYLVYRHISVLDIMRGTLSKEERAALKGGIVLVGSTAMGAFDHYPSPFFASWPGVELHANVIDNILHDDFLKPISGWIFLGLVLVVIWMPILLAKYSIKVISLASAGFMFALLIFNIFALTRLYDMPYLSILIAMVIPFIFVTTHKAILEGREKKWIKNTFGQYLSPKVVEIITKDPSKLKLGGEKRDMTAMFADIASFTTISEKLTPEQLTAMLNAYLSGLTDEILKHDGVVDKFIGDCIMAFWNAPLDLKNHRTQACLAAVDCLAVNNRLNAAAKDMPIKPNFRIGLNAGPMTVGNMGSQNRFSYTAIGDAVNLASRLEGANKFFHSRIMASAGVFDEAKDLLDSRYLGQIRVVGKAIPVKVYELFARKGEAAPEIAKMIQPYGTGMANFYAGKYQESAKDFKAALTARPEDGPSQFYIDLAEKYVKEPPKEWDGTFNLESK